MDALDAEEIKHLVVDDLKSNTIIPEGYKSILNVRQTQRAIEDLKQIFSSNLRNNLNLKRASAPLFLSQESGLNDDLGGNGNAVAFAPDYDSKKNVEIVQSLAKWKRFVLARYGYQHGEGIVAELNAIRKHEKLDNIHSIYVDQWDWELVIDEGDRNLYYLFDTVKLIVDAINKTSRDIRDRYDNLPSYESREVSFVSTQELENLFPDKTNDEREYLWAKDHLFTFVYRIGHKLDSGKPHDKRASDYDDWNLNGDLLIYDQQFDRVIEISSMGIRVDANSLAKQLELAGENYKRELPYHQGILNNELPLTIGGGIGQSRLSLLLLGKAHIGEVQSSVWDEETIRICQENNVDLF